MELPSKLSLAVLAMCATTPFAFAATTPSLSLNQLRQDHPKLQILNIEGKITKMVAPDMATGKTPMHAAKNFLRTWAHSLNANANEFVAEGPFEDGHHTQQIMYDQETGLYKFTGVYFKQLADGLPVYGTRLMTLSRNVGNNPIVNVEVNLRDVKGFKKPAVLINNSALALMAAATRFGTSVTTTTPELMVYAGSQEEHAEPRAVIVFEAKTGGNWDTDSYQKAELIVDAETGEILHEKNLILHVDGNVSGVATESSGADVCDPESAMGMPYATVTLGGNSAFADANGDFTIAGSGTITSTLDGRWFDSRNQSGSDASLSQNSSNPYFMHNDPNNNEQYRAQVNGYLQSNIVRDYALNYFPNFPTIDTQTSFPINTGVSGTCNAFYDGGSINFYNAGSGCSNTAFSVVVHHEYGHHMVSVAGSGQGQYGEGMGDVMGVLITGDNQLARGFYSDDCTNGIRNADNNKQYPCSGGIHDCGQLISGCVWDALIQMENAYGSAGRDIVASLAINSMVMHSGDGISPSITLDWLTLDDDDGDLTNGTPHSVELLAGFAMHNMADFPEPLENDECSAAVTLVDGSHSFTTVGASNSGDSYDDSQCGGTYLGEMSSDVWFSYTACENGSMQVSTCDLIDFDSDIVVYEGNCGNKTQIACNGDGDNCGGYSSDTSFTVTQGNDYLIRVGGWGSSSMGSGQLLIDGPGEPCDTTPPCVGDIDEDGTVGVTDLLAIVGMWGETGGAGDIDGSGAVGVGDLLMAIDAWGDCPE